MPSDIAPDSAGGQHRERAGAPDADPPQPGATAAGAALRRPPQRGAPSEDGTRIAVAPAGDPAAWLIAFAVFAAYLTISLSRYYRLDPGSWDLGIYTEYVKQFAHLHAPVVLIRGPHFNLLGDHFQPIVALLAPFFRLFPTPVTLLVAQAALTAVSVLPVCRAARELLGTGVSRAIGAAYGFSWGLQQMINFDFHEVAFAVPLLAFALSALVRRRPLAAALWAAPLVLVKEDQGFTVAAIGLVMLGHAAWERLHPRGRGDGPPAWLWPGVALVVWGLVWSAVTIGVIIPHLNPAHHYQYWSDGGVLRPGAHPSPGQVLAQLGVAGPRKLRTLALILAPGVFLALGSPVGLVAAPGLALRFLSTNSYFWGTGYHYDATVMPIVFVAAIDVLARIRRRPAPAGAGRAAHARHRFPITAPGLAAAAMVAVAGVLALRFPLAQVWAPQTYRTTAHVRAEYAAMDLVPSGTSVEATLSMLAPLAARDRAYWVGTVGGADPRYIVFDADNSGWSPPPSNIAAFVAQQHPGARYLEVFRASDVYVFRSTGRTRG